MTDRPLTSHEFTLVSAARNFKYDEQLDPIADAMDSGDYETWSKVHPLLQDRASMYRDFRANYREAVNLGLVANQTD